MSAADSSVRLPAIASLASPTSTRYRAWALALGATLTMAVSHMDRKAMAVLAPTITRALGISESAYGWLSAAFAASYLLAAPPSGRFIERLGARRGLLVSVLFWSVVSAAHAFVPGLWTLLALRLLLGVAEGPCFPGSAQTLSRALPKADRHAGYGLVYCGSTLGGVLAPLVATALEARWGWRFALLGTAAAGLLWIPLWLTVTRTAWARETLAPRPRAEPSTTPDCFTWTQLCRHRAVIRCALLVIGSAPALFFFQAWGAKLLVALGGLTQREVGGYLWFPALAFDVGAFGLGLLASASARRGRRGRNTVALGGALLVAAMVANGAIATLGLSHAPKVMSLVFGVTSLGAGGIYALATASMMHSIPSAWIASAAGVVATAQSFAQLVAGPVIGAARDHGHSYSVIACALGVWVIAVAGAALLIKMPATDTPMERPRA
jgi:ACS family hexuronate transporter-like MFS transporter